MLLMKTVSKLCLYTLIVAALLFSPEIGPWFAWLMFYFLPSIAAFLLSRSRIVSILLCNILFGWTVVGWIVILIVVLLRKTAGQTSRTRRQHTLAYPPLKLHRLSRRPQE